MSSCAALLDQLEPEEHVVQLYGEDDRLLTQNVGRFLEEGLKRSDGLLVIANAGHRGTLARHLKQERGYSRAVLEGRLVYLDAETTLARFMLDGSPDPDLFEEVVGDALRGVQKRGVHPGVRAYGEMVGVLWQAGKHAAAIRLEGLWNELLESNQVSLFCAYPIDVFSPEFRIGNLDALLCAHTHLLPVDSALEGALDQAMDEVLGARVEGLRQLIQSNYRPSWAEIPRAEALVLWLRNNLPGSADQIIQLARQHFQSSAGLA
jgi:hypothetical protein